MLFVFPLVGWLVGFVALRPKSTAIYFLWYKANELIKLYVGRSVPIIHVYGNDGALLYAVILAFM